MENAKDIISGLNFAEKCIKLVSPNPSLFFEAKSTYRKNNISIDRYCSYRENTPEFIICKAYDFFRFACINNDVSFYIEQDDKLLEVKDKFGIKDNIYEMYKNKGIVNGNDIYVSKNAYSLLTVINEAPIYNPLINDSFMMKCYKKVVEHILNSLNVKQIPYLKESAIAAYIDEIFPPSEYSESGFSVRKREILQSLLKKEKAC